MPYSDPEKRRQAARESMRRKRKLQSRTTPASRSVKASPMVEGDARELAENLEDPMWDLAGGSPRGGWSPTDYADDDWDDWLPEYGDPGFRAPFDGRQEEELWRRYLDNWSPAGEGLMHFEYPNNHPAPRAVKIAAILSGEAQLVRRVARWRRHHPVEKWEALNRWLASGDIERAKKRLRRLGLLPADGKPFDIIR